MTLMPDISFPSGFVALDKYPGYFWNVQERKLYSIKIAGILQPLKLQNSWGWKTGAFIGPHYRVSKDGRQYYLTVERIEKMLKIPHVIPVLKVRQKSPSKQYEIGF